MRARVHLAPLQLPCTSGYRRGAGEKQLHARSCQAAVCHSDLIASPLAAGITMDAAPTLGHEGTGRRIFNAGSYWSVE